MSNFMAILGTIYVSPIEQFVGALVLPHCVFPYVFMEAVTSAYIEQLFYRDVIGNRSTRLTMALRANCVAALVGVLACLGCQHFGNKISRLTPESLEFGFVVMLYASLFAFPVAVECLFWNRWTRRPIWIRVFTANCVSGIVTVAVFVFIRWLREHLPHSIEWKLRRFYGDDSWYMSPISWSCFTILMLAWVWRMPTECKSDPAPSQSGSRTSTHNGISELQ